MVTDNGGLILDWKFVPAKVCAAKTCWHECYYKTVYCREQIGVIYQ